MPKEFRLQIDRAKKCSSCVASTAIDAIRTSDDVHKLRHGAIHLVTETSQNPHTNYEVVRRIELVEIDSEEESETADDFGVSFFGANELDEENMRDSFIINLSDRSKENKNKHPEIDLCFTYEGKYMATLSLEDFKTAWAYRRDFLKRNLRGIHAHDGIKDVIVVTSSAGKLNDGTDVTPLTYDIQKYMTSQIRSIIYEYIPPWPYRLIPLQKRPDL